MSDALEQAIAKADEERARNATPEGPRLAPISLDKRGIIAPADASEEARFAQMMLTTRVLPECFVTREQVMLAMQMLRTLGVPPAIGIRQVMVVNNVLAIWGELPKAACQHQIEAWEEFRFTEDYKPISFENRNLHETPFGAVARVKRRGEDRTVEGYFTIPQARAAGLFGRKGPWTTYTDRMLQMRARSRALKDAFPDILSGVAIAEYDYNILGGRGEAFYGDAGEQRAKALADELNAPESALTPPAEAR